VNHSNGLIAIIDWFIPNASQAERSELSLARNFIFTHLFDPGGRISGTSEPGEGSCFTIAVAAPASERSAIEDKQPAIAPPFAVAPVF
jgi:hypothetical protein